jgi:hypothetical protein
MIPAAVFGRPHALVRVNRVNIDWVIPCRYAEVHDNLGTIVGAGIDVFVVPELPSVVQVNLAIRITATAEELAPGKVHQGRTIIVNPNGETGSEAEIEFALGVENPRTDWLNGFIFPATVQFEAADVGTYTIEHVLGGQSNAIPIHVVQGVPEELEDAEEP